VEETHVEGEPDEDLGPTLPLAHRHRGCDLFYPSVGEHLACNDVSSNLWHDLGPIYTWHVMIQLKTNVKL